MKLLKRDERPAEFVWKDVKFSVRTNMTVADKFKIDTLGEWKGDGSVSFSPWPYYLKLIELFVVSWTGVVDENDKEVPWSFDVFMNDLAADASNNVVLTLGAFIADKIGIIKLESNEAKKD